MWFLWQPPNWNIHHTCPICCVPGYTGCYSVIPHKNKALLVQIIVLRSGTCTAVSTVLMGVTPSELTVRFEHPHKYWVATQPILPTTWIQCTLHCLDQTACSANVLANCFHSHHPALIIVKIEGEGLTHFSMCLAITVYLGRQRREITLWGLSFFSRSFSLSTTLKCIPVSVLSAC